MVKKKLQFIFTIIFCVIISSLNAQILKRKASLGIYIKPIQNKDLSISYGIDSIEGILVTGVHEKSTSHLLGLKKGDLILEINQQKVKNYNTVYNVIKSHVSGDSVEVRFIRNGDTKTSKGYFVGRPFEERRNAKVLYDEVTYYNGTLRTIIAYPTNTYKDKFPVIFLIQGYGCDSYDNLTNTSNVSKVIDGFLSKGYAVVRTQKPNIGDSKCKIDCKDLDFYQEVDAFQASFDALNKYSFIDKNEIYILGLSMGGVIAPMIQQNKLKAKGIVVFGTVSRPWFEYFIDQYRRQNILLGQDFVENEQGVDNILKFYYDFMINKKSPIELYKNSKYRNILKYSWGNIGDNMYLNGRHAKYWQSLQDIRPYKRWKDCSSYVLSLWGEGDFVAFSKEDHVMISKVVNTYHPNHATYLTVPFTDHSFTKVSNQKESIKYWNNYKYKRDNYNPIIVELINRWTFSLPRR
ncbi:MAG: PDZ domain-containing protein [Hyphomicrobiales bacterium]